MAAFPAQPQLVIPQGLVTIHRVWGIERAITSHRPGMATLDTVETSPNIASPEELLSHAGWIRGLARRLVAEHRRADESLA